MFLKDMKSGDLVELLDLNALIDPNTDAVNGRIHAGEEMQDATSFSKAELRFPSDEALPRCWRDSKYRD